MSPRFQDRSEAGRFLAGKLKHYANDSSVIVLGLPRGGVPVAYEIAQQLNTPLDIFVVRKLGVPGYEELAMGAIASGGIRVLNEEIIQRMNIPPEAVEAVTREEEQEVARCEAVFRGDREPVEISGKTVILTDDGLATGATMRAAVRALQQMNPASIVVAVPVGSKESCEQFLTEVDELICGDTPEPFFAVGTWYSNFLPTTDDEVNRLLNHAAHERRVRRVREGEKRKSEALRH